MTEAESPEATYRCARHPSVETVLRCSRCETPICPNCLVYTPVGARCPDCGKSGPNPIYQVGGRSLARAAGLAIVASLAGALAWLIVSSVFRGGFFLFLVGAGIGHGIGEAISWAANRRRGPVLMALAGVSAGVAFLLGLFVAFFLSGAPPLVALAAALGQLTNLFTLLAVALSVVLAVSRVR